jgi:hypothetical protein
MSTFSCPCRRLTILRTIALCSNENQAIKRREEVIAAIAKCTRSAILTLKGDFESAEAQEIINPWIVKSLAFVLQFKYLLNEKGVAPDLIVLLHKIFSTSSHAIADFVFYLLIYFPFPLKQSQVSKPSLQRLSWMQVGQLVCVERLPLWKTKKVYSVPSPSWKN